MHTGHCPREPFPLWPFATLLKFYPLFAALEGRPLVHPGLRHHPALLLPEHRGQDGAEEQLGQVANDKVRVPTKGVIGVNCG